MLLRFFNYELRPFRVKFPLYCSILWAKRIRSQSIICRNISIKQNYTWSNKPFDSGKMVVLKNKSVSNDVLLGQIAMPAWKIIWLLIFLADKDLSKNLDSPIGFVLRISILSYAILILEEHSFVILGQWLIQNMHHFDMVNINTRDLKFQDFSINKCLLQEWFPFGLHSEDHLEFLVAGYQIPHLFHFAWQKSGSELWLDHSAQD